MQSILACPSDIFSASADHVWNLVARPDRFAAWAEVTLVEGPDRPVVAGDRFRFRKGPFSIGFEVVSADPPCELGLDVHLPFGVINREVVRISAAGKGRCRVTFN